MVKGFLVSSMVLGLGVAACGGDSTSRTPVVDGGGSLDGALGEGHTGGQGGGTSHAGGSNAGGSGTDVDAAAGGAGAGGRLPGDSGTNAGDASVRDGSLDGGSTDASAADASSTCDYGTAGSFATQAELNLFGEIVYFQDGAVLPAGRYRLTYEDGCMKYASDQGWTVHAYANGAVAAWWIVGETYADRITVPPGTVGYYTSNGAFDTFDECVAANAALPPTEFDFGGGKLGVWLLDSNYGDNLAGTDGRNPRWKLTLLGACVPGGDR